MQAPFLIGEKVYLRGVAVDDVSEKYLRWMNDPQVTKYMGWRAFPSSKEAIKDYIESRRGESSLFLAIVEKETDEHIGNVHLGPIDWVHRRAELAMLLGETDFWGQGYMSEVFALITQHAFECLNLHKLKAGTEVGNSGAVKVFQKSGWIEEGRLRAETFREGAYRDMVLFACFNPSAERHGATEYEQTVAL